jgi:hypothetical protein
MTPPRSAIVTVAFGHSTERLDHTFTSFAINEGVPLHALIVGQELPEREKEITYHLIQPWTTSLIRCARFTSGVSN